MNPIEEIRAALLLANPKDLEMFRRYLEWMKIRRRITDRFYFSAHWVTPPPKVHWVGIGLK